MAGKLTQVGLGYVVDFPDEQIYFILDHMRQTREGPTAELNVYTNLPDTDSYIHWARLNLVDSHSRDRFIFACRRRLRKHAVNWESMLEYVCREVVLRERQSQPFSIIEENDTPPSNEWLIENFIYRNEPTALFGDGGSGKSRFCLATALSIQTGTIFIPGLVPVIIGPVLYMDWESSKDRLSSRIAALCKGVDLPRTPIHYRNCVEPLQDQTDDVTDYCKKHNIVLVIIDSMEMAMAGTKEGGSDANDSAVKLYASLRMIGVASLMIDHVSKAELGNTGQRSQYGSIFKRNLARMQFELRLTGTFDDYFNIDLIHTKRNDDGKLNSQVFYKVEYDDTKTVYSVGFDDDVSNSGPDTNEAIMILLRERNIPLTPKQISEYLGKTSGSIRIALHRLTKKNLITHSDEGYTISENLPSL